MEALVVPLHWGLFLLISLADLVVIEFLFLFSPIWVKMAQFTTLPKIRVGFSGTSRAHMLRDGAGLAKGFGDL